MIRRRQLMTFVLAGFLGLPGGATAGPLTVVATNSDIGAIAKEIGGTDTRVEVLVPPAMDPHNLPLKPSVIQRIQEADVLLTVGLDHEPWLQDALTAAGNRSVLPGGKGYVDCSPGVPLLEVPSGPVDRSRGDLHIFGNTHYWLNPNNAKIIAIHITHGLSERMPEQKEEIRNRARSFLRSLDQKIQDWKRRLSRHEGTPIVTYHRTWPYMADFGGFRIVDTVEMLVGVEPSPKHIARLTERMKREGIRAIVMAPYFNKSQAQSIASRADATVHVIAPSTPEGQTYTQHMERVVSSFERALSGM